MRTYHSNGGLEREIETQALRHRSLDSLTLVAWMKIIDCLVKRIGKNNTINDRSKDEKNEKLENVMTVT